ncbi:YihY family inner membrane protein [Extensimonas sp. H3M7-6]|uniref:YihY family inner membrane protein n=1 Tax=Extensimonas soli TaxID=3031322 RepID=UPI0023DB877B|nr:YhjD/YihY/BrkB family envelope integrity protein [Extensimonas sp. H3M7-6]MDF1481625.1 YihY family inner membrane protein [Extensimonas sp. H3M7-6]
MNLSFQAALARMRVISSGLAHFPWRNTLQTLRERFHEDHLALTAGSLTFTSVLALVPFVTVALAVFTAFPMFAELQKVLQRWLVESLVPESIARQVLGYVTQFSAKASRLGVAGFSMLLVTALALILTIDGTLNAIWRVRRLRPLTQRVLIYWAGLTLGPLALGASLALTSYVMSVSGGLAKSLPAGVRLLFDSIQFFMLAAGMAALYRYVPNTPVKWRDAWAGGLFVAVGMELAKKLLALYLSKVPTYSVIYGAFATLPIFLLWIYVAWLIVLFGAVVAAYLPVVLMGVARRGGAGWAFQLAVEVLQALHAVRGQPAKGLRLSALARRLRVDALQLEPVLETLQALDWVGQVSDPAPDGSGAPNLVELRYVLLAEVQSTPLAPLLQRLLLERTPSVEALWQRAELDELMLADVLLKE